MITNAILLTLMIQNANLIHIDIFECTKPNYYRQFYLKTTHKKYNGSVEANPIADYFFSRNLWELGFFTALTTEYLGVFLLQNIDKSNTLSVVFLEIVNALEVVAFYSWASDPATTTAIKCKSVFATVYFYRF
jgi:hypothetical protein